MSDRLDQAIRERFNALAVHCDKLEQENARLRDNGRIESYVRDLQALTQLASDVGIPDAESTGHGTLVFQLREKFKTLKHAEMPSGSVCFVRTGDPAKNLFLWVASNCPGFTPHAGLYEVRTLATPMLSSESVRDFLATENRDLRDQLDAVTDQRDQATSQLIAVESERDTLRQEVERLRECSKRVGDQWKADLKKLQEACATIMELQSQVAANQEAADVLRLIEVMDPLSIEVRTSPTTRCHELAFTRRNGDRFGAATVDWKIAVHRWAKSFGITLPAKEEPPPVKRPNRTKPMHSPEVQSAVEAIDGAYAAFSGGAEPAPAAESGYLNASLRQQLAEARELAKAWEIVASQVSNALGFEETYGALRLCQEIESLRRDREAWDAVRRHGMELVRFLNKWSAIVFRHENAVEVANADPREAVLQLARTLEGGK